MMVVRNNEMLEGLFELKEENIISKFFVKLVVKYFVYLLFLIGIIIFFFYFVYNFKDEFGISVGGLFEVFKVFYKKFYVKNDIVEFVWLVNVGYIVRVFFVFLLFGIFVWLIF